LNLAEDRMPDGIIKGCIIISKSAGSTQAIALLPDENDSVKSQIPEYKKLSLSKDKGSTFNNFNELIFFTNSVYGYPVFNDVKTFNKYLAIIYGASPAEMARVISSGEL